MILAASPVWIVSEPIVEAIGWSLVHFVWQGLVIAGLLALALLPLQRRPAQVRYLAGCAALLLMALCLAGTLTGEWQSRTAFARQPAARPTAEPVPVETPVSAIPESEPARSLVGSTAEVAETPRPHSGLPDDRAETQPGPSPAIDSPPGGVFLPWLVGAWMLGVTGLSVRLCAGWWSLQRLRQAGTQPVSDEWNGRLADLARKVALSRPVRLLESTLVEVPTVIGWLRPVVLLPVTALTGLSVRQVEAILVHELAHIRRHDVLVNLLQTALETVLFYHPAVWWISRLVRAEREACCDEVAVQICGNPVSYARALATLEELRGTRVQLAVSATGHPLLTRIRRLVGLPAQEPNRSAWWIVAGLAASLLAVAIVPANHSDRAGADEKHAETTAGEEPEWGEESEGLRCRLIPVSPRTDDEAPAAEPVVREFAHGSDVTFAVELKNVSDQPITLLGVRYGDSYASAKGKLATGFFGPHLFEFQFRDREGRPMARTKREYLADGLHTHGASTHVVEPGGILRLALRPARFGAPMNQALPPGEYLASVRYVGLKSRDREMIAKHWPDSAQVTAWGGQVESAPVSLEVRPDESAGTPVELVWGDEQEGLRAAVEFRPRTTDDDSDAPRRPRRLTAGESVPLNSSLDIVLHVQNVSDDPITLVSETWRQEDQLEVKRDDDQIVKVGGSWYSGWPTLVRWTLRPGEIADLQGAAFAIAASPEALQDFEHPVGKSIIARAGTYFATYTIRIGSIQQRDDQGNVTVPARNDWQGKLVTGATPITVRDRTPDDDAAAERKLFTGKIVLTGPEGRPVEGGVFTAQPTSARKPLAAGEFSEGTIEIPRCPPRPLRLTVRAPGYEETVLPDLKLERDVVRTVELTPTEPARFRLVSTVTQKPVAGAIVRFFNRTSADAGGGPFPTDGTAGPVWAVSGEDGTVLLESLQKVNPDYRNLGDALYYFYIESPELAPRFVGPLRAGEDAGDLEVGPYLEVRGEIRGTPAEIEQFTAEWDQPFEQVTDNPAATWLYAVSQNLDLLPLPKLPAGVKGPPPTRRSFVLRGLRPGPLRIIANFQMNKEGVSHTYGRRDPKGADLVFDYVLTESVDNLVITPAGPQTGD